MKKRYLFSIILFMVSFSLAATNHFVKTTGNGDGSSWDNAFSPADAKTAVEAAVAGDTFFFAEGTYKFGSVLTVASGIVIQGGYADDLTGSSTAIIYPTSDATIFSGDNTHPVLLISSRSKVVIKGIVVTEGLSSADGDVATDIRPGIHIRPGVIVDMYYCKSLSNTTTATQGNSAGGAGLYIENTGVQAYLYQTEIANNTAENRGGGIRIGGVSTLTLDQCLVRGNSISGNYGGGIQGSGVSPTIVLINTTVTGNSANIGGGVSCDGKLYVISSTIANNSAAATAEGVELRSRNASSLFKCINSIVVGGATDAMSTNAVNHVSEGFNIWGSNNFGSGGGFTITATDVQDETVTTVFGENTLGDNGGNLTTYAPLTAKAGATVAELQAFVTEYSNVVTRGDITKDARGYNRDCFAATSIGAYDPNAGNVPYIPKTITLTSDADDGAGSLRQALAEADCKGGDTIIIPAGYEITLLSEITIDKKVVIKGNGATVKTLEPGVSNYRLFTVQDDVLLKDLDMQGGKIAGNGGAILASTATNLIIQNCTLQNSKANNGGALYFSAGNLIVENSVFTNDSANTGAAIYNVGEAKIYGSYFHHNVMNHNNGGTVANYALNGQKLTVEKSTFAFNKNHSTTNGGAGVFQNAANTECIISNSTFYNNVSQIAPVWIGLSKGTVVNSTIVGNVGTSTSNGYGTGLFLRNDATTTAVVVNNIIAYNWKKSTAEYIDIYAGTNVVKSGTNNILGMNFGSIAAFANSQSVNYAAGENRLFAEYTTIDVDGTSVKIPAFDETTLTVQLGSRSNAIGAGVSTYGTPNIVPQYDQLDSLRAIPQCLGSREEKKAEGGNIHKPLEASSPVIWGNGYGENSFSRFPASYESSIKAIPANGDAIWTRTNLSAGLQIRFRTNADTIRVRYSIESAYTGNQWYASMGSDGIDLYARKGTDMYWCNPSEIAIANEFVYGNLTPDDASYSSNGYEYCLYLPSFVKTTALEIEVDEDADFEYVEANPVKKPIVFYGTSIINGAASSRAGNNYTNIISRSIYDRNIVNLGFSGSGRMEKPVIAAINDIDADIYVLDCLPNMGGTYISTIQNLYIAAVDSIKKYHPTAAIILTEHPGYASMDVYQTHYTTVTDENTELQAAKAVIDSRGYGGIYYISMEDLGMDRTADFSDYIHPNDKGMNVYAAKYLQIIKSILGE